MELEGGKRRRSSKKSSKKGSKKGSKKVMDFELEGGKRRKASKKASKKGSKRSGMKREMNPAMKQVMELKGEIKKSGDVKDGVALTVLAWELYKSNSNDLKKSVDEYKSDKDAFVKKFEKKVKEMEAKRAAKKAAK